MTQGDILLTLDWWFTIFVLGASVLPVTILIFKPFFDKGYIFAKLIGLAVTSYLVFLLSVLHIIPFGLGSIAGVAVLLTIGSYFLLLQKKELLEALKAHVRLFLFEEAVFLAVLFFWAYIHGFNPDIHGLEKYMDFGFLNSILRAEYFPPKDMWFTPFSINYYYFGHLMTAVLTKLSGLSSSITFNLMLATIAAWCFSAVFSLATTLADFLTKEKFSYGKRLFAGLLSAVLVTFAGNLHVLYAFFTPYANEAPQSLWELTFNPAGFPNNYWYPNATRFIYHTIHEFPIYSWVVADLHGHVLDIPFVLLTIAVLLSFFLTVKFEARNSKHSQNTNNKNTKHFEHSKFGYVNLFRISKFEFWYLPLIGFLLAVMYMTNAWDGPIYLLLTLFVFTFLFWGKTAEQFKGLLASFFIVLASFLFFSLPYNFFFKPFASGIGILCAPNFLTNIGHIGPFLFEKDHCMHSLWWQLLILYGFFYFFIISFLVLLAKTRKLLRTDLFVLLLIFLASILILLPELIYLKDIYPAHYRANTMFKLVFQAFILLSISSGYIIIRILTSVKRFIAIIYLPFVILLVSLVLIYPYLAIKSYYGLQTSHGLVGTTYLKALYPSDYDAIEWLNENVKGQPVILEAQGDSYTDYARVSANTGLPTVLGWTVHEWLWRGTYDIPAPRIEDVRVMYEEPDSAQAQALFKKYHVKYVFIGTLEYQKYPTLQEKKFAQFGKVVFQQGSTKIYQLNL